MKAILFPGQGSQAVGMGAEFYKNFDIVKKIFSEADEILNFKISDIILNGPVEKLKLTENTQPAILTVSYSIFSVLKKEFNYKIDDAKFFAGHSLGEYSALLCSDSISFKDSLNLLYQRGKAMQEAVPVGGGAMLAILGMDIKDINKLINDSIVNGVCEIANDNAHGQVIVSGNVESIKTLQDVLKVNKKKCIALPVSAPFHCSLMKSAADKMKEKIDKVNFNKPKFDIVSNVTSKPTQDPSEIKELLFHQIYSKVRWRETILYMAEKKVSQFIEIGPGKVLTGLVKRIIPDTNSFCINSINDIKIIENESKK